MIPSPPHRGLPLGLRRRGLSKLFVKNAVIVILPLIPGVPGNSTFQNSCLQERSEVHRTTADSSQT